MKFKDKYDVFLKRKWIVLTLGLSGCFSPVDEGDIPARRLVAAAENVCKVRYEGAQGVLAVGHFKDMAACNMQVLQTYGHQAYGDFLHYYTDAQQKRIDLAVLIDSRQITPEEGIRRGQAINDEQKLELIKAEHHNAQLRRRDEALHEGYIAPDCLRTASRPSYDSHGNVIGSHQECVVTKNRSEGDFW